MNKRDLTIFAMVLAGGIGGIGASAMAADKPGKSTKDSDRLLVNDGAVEIRRPNKAWIFDGEGAEDSVVAILISPDSMAIVTISAQKLPGFELKDLKRLVENTHATRVKEFKKLVGQDRQIHGLEVYQYVCTMEKDDISRKAKLLITKIADTMYIVECETNSEHWTRFKKDFDKILESFKRIAE